MISKYKMLPVFLQSVISYLLLELFGIWVQKYAKYTNREITRYW